MNKKIWGLLSALGKGWLKNPKKKKNFEDVLVRTKSSAQILWSILNFDFIYSFGLRQCLGDNKNELNSLLSGKINTPCLWWWLGCHEYMLSLKISCYYGNKKYL